MKPNGVGIGEDPAAHHNDADGQHGVEPVLHKVGDDRRGLEEGEVSKGVEHRSGNHTADDGEEHAAGTKATDGRDAPPGRLARLDHGCLVGQELRVERHEEQNQTSDATVDGRALVILVVKQVVRNEEGHKHTHQTKGPAVGGPEVGPAREVVLGEGQNAEQRAQKDQRQHLHDGVLDGLDPVVLDDLVHLGREAALQPGNEGVHARPPFTVGSNGLQARSNPLAAS